ncbi:calpain-1 catalytic subunit isoform X1 [Alosa sapidissima]|uniref:calpain-1 catalytic subunit isoform X1 n=1 Tax=Alosa sapidissima TaxID=34773 RepID=UPI001C0929CF|nr:calpain-1 catalytic subunit isoform X1 [Alosa sapidissima]
MSDTKETSTPQSPDGGPEPLGSPTLWSPSTYLSNKISSFTLTDGLFVDRLFPAGDVQLQHVIEWKRPKEICPFPQFIVDGATRMDVCQGNLNDCWLLAAVASLSLHHSLLKQVMPMAQSFQEGYNGSFHFRFWQYGEWKDVKIDDLLPTKDGKLIYLRSSQRNEFWSPLLEKAYAKLKGGYQALNMGFPHEAMVDMTGGITEVFKVANLPFNLGGFLKPLLAKGALINCANSQGPMEKKNLLGIMFRHAYSVTSMEKIETKSGPVELVRLHNPWGRAEWEGPWSDIKGQEWNNVLAQEQQRIERVKKEDGEFWMSLSDFRQNFDMMEICHLSDDTLSSAQRPWHGTMYHGKWVDYKSAGGPYKGERYWQNPQFHLTLLEQDDDPEDPELSCSFLVALMQKHQRQKGVHLSIGLHIYKANSKNRYLSSLELSQLEPVDCTPSYLPCREVVIRGCLAPGHYIIIPSTSQKHQEGEFLLRVLTEKGNGANPVEKPSSDETVPAEPSPTYLSVLPSLSLAHQLFKKHCNKDGQCRPAELFNLLTEAIRVGALSGSEQKLCIEHCKSFVVLMDSQGLAQLDWLEFQALWNKFKQWTYIFMRYDYNKSHSLEYKEIRHALRTAGIQVDEFIMQLIGLRYTEPDMTVSYPGFLYLMMKLESMIRKFQAYDMIGMGTITINSRQWLHMTLYN